MKLPGEVPQKRSNISSMKNEKNLELAVAKDSKLTVYDKKTNTYYLPNQRNCFYRCSNCVNLSECDSYTDNETGEWKFVKECSYCVQRVINMLGYFEHGVVPEQQISDLPKTRQSLEEKGSIYDILQQMVKNDS